MSEEKQPSCLDCPSHEVIPDPDPHDWFCYDDEATVCTLVPNPNKDVKSEYLSDRGDFRIVSGGNRPYGTKKFSNVPDWCPKRK